MKFTHENALKLLTIGYNLGLFDDEKEIHKEDLEAFASQAVEAAEIENRLGSCYGPGSLASKISNVYSTEKRKTLTDE